MTVPKKINLSLSYFLSDESDEILNTSETAQGRIDSHRKLAETTHLPRSKRPTSNIGQNNPGRNDSTEITPLLW